MTEPGAAAERRAMIAALLGPSQPELTCETCFAELDRYVDLELAALDADRLVPGMRAHLAGCPACREDHQSLRDFVRAEGRPARAGGPPHPPAGSDGHRGS